MKLEARNLALSYSGAAIFKNLSFEVSCGEIVAIAGPNGSGKSSLALCLSGLLDRDAENVEFGGRIFYGGKNVFGMTVAERCAAVGAVFQNPDNQLFSPLVAEELAFAPENLCLPREEIARRVDGALEACGITSLKNARTADLSGGEKQLVAVAAVLTMKPLFLIADEITARADAEKKKVLREILVGHARNGGGVIMVSHSDEDLSIADRVIVMERGRDYGNQTL